MSKSKCCGNCKHFKYEDAVGWGRCIGHMKEFGVHCSHTGCLEHKFVKNAINGWTEITPDNEHELTDKLIDRTVIGWRDSCNRQHIVAFADCAMGVGTMAKYGGYWYYVLPELKIE